LNYSLLRYPGGKSRSIKELEKYIPKNTKEILSPFFGGGSFELYLATKNIKINAYDNFYPLVCFWNSVLWFKNDLIKIIQNYYPLSKESFYELQNNIDNIDNQVELGAIFYVLNRSSFSGTGLSGGMSPNHPRFTKSSIERIRNFDTSFDIEYLSFEKSILKHDCLIYADPPYLINQQLYGNKGNMHRKFDHKLLSNILNNRGNFILSYNNCEQVRDMYCLHNFVYPEWKYGMGNNKKSNEILIISKDI